MKNRRRNQKIDLSKQVDRVKEALKERYGDGYVLDRKADIDGIVTEWLISKKQARRFNDDAKMREVDILYSSRLKSVMLQNNIPEVDSVSPPLQIPMGILNSLKKEKIKDED